MIAVLAATLLAPAPVALIARAQQSRPDAVRAPSLVREGRYLVDAPGLLRLGGEDWVFDTFAEGSRRTFTLMPSLKLGELEQVAAARGEGEYRVSGRVFVYENRNFLLVTGFASVGERDDPMLGESATGAPSVADLIREFERTRADRRQSRPGGPGGVGDAGSNERRGEAIALRREGSQLSLVRGRIIQNPAGWAYFEPLPLPGALEPDPAATIPVAMLPSLMLEEVEALAAFSASPPVVTLSGEYFAHRGRNYILPRQYLVERTPTDRDADLPPIAGEVAR
jgi:hypothetical protein